MIEISALRLRGDGMKLVEILRANGVEAFIADGTRVSASTTLERSSHVLAEFCDAIRTLDNP